jgi:hypothetical protein
MAESKEAIQSNLTQFRGFMTRIGNEILANRPAEAGCTLTWSSNKVDLSSFDGEGLETTPVVITLDELKRTLAKMQKHGKRRSGLRFNIGGQRYCLRQVTYDDSGAGATLIHCNFAPITGMDEKHTPANKQFPIIEDELVLRQCQEFEDLLRQQERERADMDAEHRRQVVDLAKHRLQFIDRKRVDQDRLVAQAAAAQERERAKQIAEDVAFAQAVHVAENDARVVAAPVPADNEWRPHAQAPRHARAPPIPVDDEWVAHAVSDVDERAQVPRHARVAAPAAAAPVPTPAPAAQNPNDTGYGGGADFTDFRASAGLHDLVPKRRDSTRFTFNRGAGAAAAARY